MQKIYFCTRDTSRLAASGRKIQRISTPRRGHLNHYSLADVLPSSVQTEIIANIKPITQFDRILLTKEFI